MLRAIAIDNDPVDLNRVEELLQRERNVELCGKYKELKKALMQIRNEKIDIVFMEIEIPEMNGIEFAKRLIREGIDIEIVYVTKHKEYALKAFGIHAAGYIIKSLRIADTQSQIADIIKRIEKRHDTNEKGKRKIIVKCLGEFLCYTEDKQKHYIKWRTAKAEELFAMLVHYRGKPIERDIVIDSLWPEMEIKRAANNLYTTSYYIRKALYGEGMEDVFVKEGSLYWIDTKMVDSDIYNFGDLMKDNAIKEDRLKKIEQIYKGMYMGNKTYEWAKSAAMRMESEFKTIMFKFAEHYEGVGDNEKVREVLKRIITEDPYNEEAYTRLLWNRIEADDRKAVLHIYKGYKNLLQSDLEIEPPEYMQVMIKNYLHPENT